MDVWTLLRTTLRRWYVFVPVLVVALALGYTAARDLPPVYVTQSSAILTGPALIPGDEEGEIDEINPFLSLGGSLTTTTAAMVVLMDSEPTRYELDEAGLETEYEVDRVDAVLYFDVEGLDEVAVTETANELVRIADVKLAELQEAADSDPDTRIQVVPLTSPQVALEGSTGGVQLIAVAGVVGLVLGSGLAVALDGFLTWRRRRAEEATLASESVSAVGWSPADERDPVEGDPVEGGQVEGGQVEGGQVGGDVVELPEAPTWAAAEEPRDEDAPATEPDATERARHVAPESPEATDATHDQADAEPSEHDHLASSGRRTTEHG
ncbi:hypothetical protein J4G33_09240 [Actinotalea sp. BY-33]|uniref:Polysaccharide chain length determinant N-terminal domain-containing protein n=1 Tax=Actinotalea soli TaxID=2819234 RepID=A0A939LPH0_9CELL|nr:hypothetical protein [Actinotalea soli]MBO1751986.1 hypothetical protein [Actinotalea soli]